MSCIQTIADYGLRSIGIGERLLPRSDFTMCQQFTLIGSGMIWNLYFGILALLAGFFLAARLPVAASVVIVVAMEGLAAWMIRDNLMLNVLMLLYPVPAIRDWQAGG